MKKIKVVEIVSGINFGGVEILLLNCFQHMDLEKYEITIITHDNPDDNNTLEFIKLGVKICRVVPKRKNIIKNFYQLYKLIKSINPDVVHCHMTLSNYMSLLVAKMLNVKIRIAHSHEANKDKFDFLNNIKRKVINYTSTLNLSCSCEASKYSYGNSDAIIISNGIDVDKFRYNAKARKKIREKFGFAPQDFVVGNVGRVVQVKNQEKLIKVFDYYYKNINSKSKLVIIGDGPLKENIIDLSRSLNIDDVVHFIDPVSDIYDYYNCFDIYVITSFTEGFGLTAIEAQVNGLPCLISYGVPSKVILSDNVEQLDIADSDEKWANILSIIDKKRRFNDNIEDSDFNIKNTCEKLEKIYDGIDIT